MWWIQLVHTSNKEPSARLVQVRKMYEYNTIPKQNLSANVWVTWVKMTQPKHEDMYLSFSGSTCFIIACAAPFWIDAEFVGRYGYPGRGSLGGGSIEYEVVYEPFRVHGVNSRGCNG